MDHRDPPSSSASPDSVVLVDGHVHIYDCYDRRGLLDRIYANFESAAARLGVPRFSGVLLLTESAGHHFFDALVDSDTDGRSEDLDGWQASTTEEAGSVILQKGETRRLFLISGRQIETEERIEISALFLNSEVDDRLPLEDTVQWIAQGGGLPVFPWGVGKWIGRRGRLISKCLEQSSVDVRLSDNGSRPYVWPRPSQFGASERSGHGILAGTDPLPFPEDDKRIGSFGFWFDGLINPRQPAADVRRAIESAGNDLKRYGELQNISRFVKNRRAMSAFPYRSSGAAFLGERETPDIETSSANYASRFAGPVGTYMLQMQGASLDAVLADESGATILDVGGGHAQLTRQLLDKGLHVTVFGSDPVCRERLTEYQDNARFRFASGNLFELPFADRSFDYVVAVRLISHIEDRRRLYREFCRVARRAVIVDYPSWYSLNAFTPLLFSLKKRIEKNTRTYHTFAGNRLATQFAAYGFRVSAQSAQFFLPMFLHRALGSSSILQTLERWAKRAGFTRWLGSPVMLRVDRAAD